MRIGDWYRLLASGGFAIPPVKYAMTVLGSGCAVFNSVCAAVQGTFSAEQIRQTELVAPPIFIVGHWRSGTTLMHELLSLDQDLASPDNYDAFSPHHVLWTGRMLKWLVNRLLPDRRPMDSMRLTGRSPQEDDFALISLGAPTPYRDIAFCRDRKQAPPGLALDTADEAEQEQVRAALDHFFRVLTCLYGRRLILKSPPHTGRIGLLARWFPGARFLHMSRDPLELVPSTMKLWRALDMTQGLQRPRYSDRQLMDYIHESQRLMYGAYFRQYPGLAPGQLAEVRFEDLIADPVRVVRKAMEDLQLAIPSSLLPAVEDYFGQRREHRPGTRAVNASLQAEVESRWREYREAFGYAGKAALSSPH